MRQKIFSGKSYKFLFCSLLFVFSFYIFLVSPVVGANSELNYAHYKIGSSGAAIENLKLQANYRIDNINYLDFEFIYDNEEINLVGSWLLNFEQTENYNLNLKLVLAKGLSNNTFGKGIGFSGTYFAENLYFFDSSYFIEKNNKFVFEGGIALPFVSSSKLSLSIGNNYWSTSDYFLNLGILMEM